jgi:hypothetical protein
MSTPNARKRKQDISEEDLRELRGELPADEQGAVIPVDRVDDLGDLTDVEIYEGELEAGVNDDLPNDPEDLELLTELELRGDETDNPDVAAEEGMTYVPPIDPPVVPGGAENAEIASGFGVSALDDPYDIDHPSDALPNEDDMVALVRAALRADSSTSGFADHLRIAVRGSRVILRGTVDDLTDSDNAAAVAGYVKGVDEVIDQTRVRGV